MHRHVRNSLYDKFKTFYGNYFSQIISDIYKSGFSRIPVYGIDRNDIIGLILTKDLIFIDPDVSTGSIRRFPGCPHLRCPCLIYVLGASMLYGLNDLVFCSILRVSSRRWRDSFFFSFSLSLSLSHSLYLSYSTCLYPSSPNISFLHSVSHSSLPFHSTSLLFSYFSSRMKLQSLTS